MYAVNVIRVLRQYQHCNSSGLISHSVAFKVMASSCINRLLK